MAHAVCDSASLAAILFQVYHSDRAGRDVRRLQACLPRPARRRRRLVQLMRLRELQRGRDRLIRAAIAHEQDLPPSPGICLSSTRLSVSIAATLTLCAVVAVLLLKVFNRFFQHAAQPVLLVESRHDERHEQLRVGGLVCFLRRYMSVLGHLPQCDVVVVPAWQGLELADAAVGFDCDVLLLRRPRRSWDRSQQVERNK